MKLNWLVLLLPAMATNADVTTSGNNAPAINGDNATVNYGIPLEKLIELAKQLGVAESERDAWMQKYKELEKQLSNRSDDIAKQAKAFLDKGNLEAAETLFKQAKQALANDLKNAATNAFSLAQINDLQYKTQVAMDYYRQSLQLDPDNADGWNRLGHLLYRVGNLDAAIVAFTKALDLGKNHQNQQEIATALNALGAVYQVRGVLDKAIAFYQKSLTINEQLGDKKGMAKNYGNLGSVYLTRGELDKAIKFYQKSLAIAEPLGDKEKMAAVFGNLGLVYKTRGELDKAIEYLQKALTLNQELGRKEGVAIQYANLGAVYKKKGNTAEARRYWQQSIALYHYIGSPMEKTVQSWLDGLH